MLVINTMARRGAIQGLVDVESSVELEEPTRPILPIYSTVTAEAVSMKDLDNNEQKDFDDRQLRPFDADGDMVQESLNRIENMQHARMIANKKLVEKAIKAKEVRNQLVKEVGFREDQWVLVRAESRNKFEGRWFGPYQIVKKYDIRYLSIGRSGGKYCCEPYQRSTISCSKYPRRKSHFKTVEFFEDSRCIEKMTD